jgi:anaerobic selenocysteine-containing dehydrogenase
LVIDKRTRRPYAPCRRKTKNRRHQPAGGLDDERTAGTRGIFGGSPHDCPDTCTMIYEVENGKLVEVRGNKDHPMTRGTLCVKLKDFHDHH